MPRLYLLTDHSGSWPIVTENELAESLADGTMVVRLVGVFADDSRGWTLLGDEVAAIAGPTGAPRRSSLQ